MEHSFNIYPSEMLSNNHRLPDYAVSGNMPSNIIMIRSLGFCSRARFKLGCLTHIYLVSDLCQRT